MQTTTQTFKPGQTVMCNGYPGHIVRHYHEGMWEVRLPGGVTCVGASDITPVAACPKHGSCVPHSKDGKWCWDCAFCKFAVHIP
jgi:hypothetical protein